MMHKIENVNVVVRSKNGEIGMEEQFKNQIQEIANLPDHIKGLYGLDTIYLVQQNKTIKNLTNHLRQEVAQLNFELFIQVMEDKIYPTEICYSYSDREGDFDYRRKLQYPIQKLKDFFESQTWTRSQKEAVEKILIFGIFLQVTRDFYCKLTDKIMSDSAISENEILLSEDQAKQITQETQYIYRDYLDILDNIAYKCNPNIYKLFSVLVKLGLCLGFAIFCTVPVAVPVIMFGSPVLIALILSGVLFFSFIVPMVSSICPLLDDTIDRRWGTNWAYRLPPNALDFFGSSPIRNAPTDIGIFPNFFYFSPELNAPVGSSFSIMNRFGFFPFKDTTNKAIELAEIIVGKTPPPALGTFHSL